jgi:hypothetical protein
VHGAEGVGLAAVQRTHGRGQGVEGRESLGRSTAYSSPASTCRSAM